VTLSILIQQNPQFPALRAKFPSIAEELLHSVRPSQGDFVVRRAISARTRRSLVRQGCVRPGGGGSCWGLCGALGAAAKSRAPGCAAACPACCARGRSLPTHTSNALLATRCNRQLPRLPTAATASTANRQVNQERSIIQELQLSPMGVISSIHPKNNNTDSRLGINIFKQVAGLVRAC
jgi:hypothetical protein